MADGLVAGKTNERVKGALQPNRHANAARRGLQAHVDTLRLRLFRAVDNAQPLIGSEVALHQRQGKGAAVAGGGEAFEQVELGVEHVPLALQVEIVHRLQYAVPNAVEGPGDSRQLPGGGLRRGRPFAIGTAVYIGATSRKPDGARLERFAGKALHLRDVLRRCLLVEHRAIAHDVNPQRIVGNLHGEIDAVRPGIQRIHVLRQGFPFPADALRERGARNVFHTFHQAHQFVAIFRPYRRETHAAAAHYHRTHTVIDTRAQIGVPGDLAVVMGMQVNKARGHNLSAGIDYRIRLGLTVAHFHDHAILDADIGRHGFAALAIVDKTIYHFQIEFHPRLLILTITHTCSSHSARSLGAGICN